MQRERAIERERERERERGLEMATAVATAVVILLTIVVIAYRLVAPKRPHPKLPPRGPLPFPIIGHLHLLLRQPLHQILTLLAARYGPILFLRFGRRPVLLLSAPSAVEECFTKNDVTFANRPLLLSGKHLSYNNTVFAAAPYGPLWRNLRRVTTLHVFSSARVAALSSARAHDVRSLLRQLFRDSAGDGYGPRRVEMKSKLSELTVNVMMQMIAGKRYHGDSATAGDEEGRRFRRIVADVFVLSGVANKEDFLPFVRWVGVNGTKKRMMRLEREMDELWQEMIDERRRWRRSPALTAEAEEKTIIDVMLSLQEKEPAFYTDEIIKGIILVIILGGIETSSGTMEWAMSLLLNNPEVLRKARAEIEMQVGHKRLVADSDLPNLPYIHNVIKETLRLFPPGPLLIPHESSSECTVGGYDIPRGTMLLVNAYAMHRDPNLWMDPSMFKPERFEIGEEQGYKFIPFGYGRRSCPGEGLAMRFVALAVGALVQCFEWERIGDMEVDLTEGEGLAMPKAIPLEAIYKPSEAMMKILSQL